MHIFVYIYKNTGENKTKHELEGFIIAEIHISKLKWAYCCCQFKKTGFFRTNPKGVIKFSLSTSLFSLAT